MQVRSAPAAPDINAKGFDRYEYEGSSASTISFAFGNFLILGQDELIIDYFELTFETGALVILRTIIQFADYCQYVWRWKCIYWFEADYSAQGMYDLLQLRTYGLESYL